MWIEDRRRSHERRAAAGKNLPALTHGRGTPSGSRSRGVRRPVRRCAPVGTKTTNVVGRATDPRTSSKRRLRDSDQVRRVVFPPVSSRDGFANRRADVETTAPEPHPRLRSEVAPAAIVRENPLAEPAQQHDVHANRSVDVGSRHVRTLMKKMGVEAIYRRPNTSKPAVGHEIHPYLLRKPTVGGRSPSLGGRHLGWHNGSRSLATSDAKSPRPAVDTPAAEGRAARGVRRGRAPRATPPRRPPASSPRIGRRGTPRA